MEGTFIEPFAGSAAMFFELQPKRAILSDLNARLMETYRAVRSEPQKVEAALKTFQRSHSTEFYYAERSRLRRRRHTRAAQFIYLNRTCWNGLYRENLSGQFNVPRGTKDRVVLPEDDWAAYAELLAQCALVSTDFSRPINWAKEGDFIFADPPYAGPSGSGVFTKYGSKVFTWNDQLRLADMLRRAHHRGVKFLVTNVYSNNFLDIYGGFAEVFSVSRHSIISGLSKGRTTTNETFITNSEAIANDIAV